MKLTCAARIALLIGAVFVSTSATSVQAIPVSTSPLRSLQSSDATSDLVSTEFSYGYKLLYKITEENPDVGAALTTVQDAVLLSLNQVIERTGSDIEIQFLASKETGVCEEAFVNNRLGDFDGCTGAESQVNVLIPTDMDPLLVERVAVGDIQTFIAEFNADRTDIQILFEYPISVSAVIRVTLQGVEGTADTLEKEVIENTFRQIFAPILQANDPTFTLDLLQVLIQNASDGVRRLLRASLRALQGSVGGGSSPYNNVNLYIRSTCEGTDCTNEIFEQIMVSEFQAITEALEIALRAAGREAGLDYFESLTSVQIGSSDLSDVLPPSSINDNNEEKNDSGKTPAWVWIMLGLDVGILLLTLAWITLHYRPKEEIKMKEYDDVQQEDLVQQGDDIQQEDE